MKLVLAALIAAAPGALEVWRGLLGLAAAAGDIQPFVAEVGQ